MLIWIVTELCILFFIIIINSHYFIIVQIYNLYSPMPTNNHSQLTWSIGFCAIYLISTILFTYLPRDAYVKAVGYTSVAMMLASFTSDLVGFGISMRGISPSYTLLFTIAISSSGIGVGVILLGCIMDTIPSEGQLYILGKSNQTKRDTIRRLGNPPVRSISPDITAPMFQPSSSPAASTPKYALILDSPVHLKPYDFNTKAEWESNDLDKAYNANTHSVNRIPFEDDLTVNTEKTRSNIKLYIFTLTNKQFMFWLFVYGITRAVHTVIMTLWTLMILEYDRNSIRYAGLIGAISYATASCCVLCLEHVHAISYFLKSMSFRQGAIAVACALVISFGLLASLSYSRTAITIAASLIGYHIVTEVLLVIIASSMGKQVLDCFYMAQKEQCQESVSSKSSYGAITSNHTLTNNFAREIGNHTHAKLKRVHLFMMTLRFAVSMFCQSVLQIVIWPKWGCLNNVFGINFPLHWQFLAYSFSLCVAGCLSLILFAPRWRGKNN